MKALRTGDAQFLRECAERMLRLADELDNQSDAPTPMIKSQPGLLGSSWDTPKTLSEGDLLERAMSEYRSRQRRCRHLPDELFGEPAWDMLVDLFIAALQRRQISVSSACLASGVPSTTALRWLGQLERMSLVAREASKHDLRVVLVKLTDQCFQTMVAYYSDLPARKAWDKNRIEEHVAYPAHPVA